MHRAWLALICVLFLSACGFKLRGAYELPFDTIYIALDERNAFRNQLKRAIESGSKAKVVNDAKAAQAKLLIISDTSEQNILSISSAGRVSEYQLVRSFSFRLVDAKNRDYLPPATILLHRDMTYNDYAVLSAGTEENLLWNDIQVDLIQQLLRRLATAKVIADGPDGANAAAR